MPVSGQELIAKNIIKYGDGFTRSVNRVMDKVRKILDDKVTENMNATYFTVEELISLDHPYAKRHGSRGRNIPDPYYKVHSRTGRLLSSKRSGTVDASINAGILTAEAFVGLDENAVPYALYVVFGTSRMIPRPFLMGSKDEVSKEAYELIKNTLKDLKVGLQ